MNCELCTACSHQDVETSIADEFECEQCDRITCIQQRHIVDLEPGLEDVELCPQCAHEEE